MIKTARKFAQSPYSWKVLAPTTFEYVLDEFPDEDTIYLPRSPLTAVNSVTYTHTDRSISTLDPTSYVVDTYSTPGRIKLFPDKEWPTFEPYPVNAVKIEFTAGFTAETLPRQAWEAMLLLIGHWYEHREAAYIGSVTHEIAFAVESLLLPMRWE